MTKTIKILLLSQFCCCWVVVAVSLNATTRTIPAIAEKPADYYEDYEDEEFELFASQKEYGTAIAKCVSVYDGDTIFVDICNWPAIIGQRVGIRLNNVDTPELRDENAKIRLLAKEAKKLVSNKLLDTKEIELRNLKRGKYFRIIADVYVNDGNGGSVNLSDILLEQKLAKPYNGGTKTPWTDADYDKYFE